MLKLFSVSSKLALTAILTLVLLVTGLSFWPAGLQELLNASKSVVRHLPDQTELPLNDQAKFLYDLVVDEQTIFGLLLTIFARLLIEIVFGLGELAFGNPEKAAMRRRLEKEFEGRQQSSGGSGYYGSSPASPAPVIEPLAPEPAETPAPEPEAPQDTLAPKKDDGLF